MNLRVRPLRPAYALALPAAALALALPDRAMACAACFGRSDDAMARGMNMGIFALLVVVLFVLSGIAAFAIYLARRARQTPAPGVTEQPAAVPETFLNPSTRHIHG